MQERAAKIIHGLDWKTPAKAVLSKLNWKTLKRTYQGILARMVHKYCYCISPAQVQELFLKGIFISTTTVQIPVFAP